MRWDDNVQEGFGGFMLSTGRSFYANGGLSLGPGDSGLYEGYDGNVRLLDAEGRAQEFTVEERHEIANYMIHLWRTWAETGTAEEPN